MKTQWTLRFCLVQAVTSQGQLPCLGMSLPTQVCDVPSPTRPLAMVRVRWERRITMRVIKALLNNIRNKRENGLRNEGKQKQVHRGRKPKYKAAD